MCYDIGMNQESSTRNLQLANRTQAFANTKALFFDVSDTLYVNEGLEKEYPRVFTEAVADLHHCSFDEAKGLIKETTERLSATEKHVTKMRAISELGVTRELAWEYIARIRPQDFLSKDAPLRDMLERLHQKYRLGVISNVPRANLLDVLGALGLGAHVFDYLVTADEVERSKPYPEPFLKAIELSGLTPAETVFIGDSPSKDIRPAKELGMQTILLKREPSAEDLQNADAYITGIDQLSYL